MKDQLISFETAKLAKEKGFNIEIQFYYLYNKKYNEGILNCVDNPLRNADWNLRSTRISAPTQSLLQKWLLNIHHINLELTFDDGKWLIYGGEFSFPDSSIDFIGSVECDSFEDAINKKSEALEKGLQEGLKLLSNV